MTSENIIVRTIKSILKFFGGFLYFTFIIALAFGPLVAGILTLIPADATSWTVSKVSYLGYLSVCSFAPFSTIILFASSILGLYLLINSIKAMKNRKEKAEKDQKVKQVIA